MWRTINDFNNYQVSKLGLVRNKKTKLIIKPFVNNNGYLRVNLYKDGVCYKKMVHVLVADAFIDNPLKLTEVDHINNRRKDNRAINLKWVTHSDNIKKVWHEGQFKKRLKVKVAQ